VSAGSDDSAGLPGIRVSDTDRERVAIALREHTVAGRLTLDEFMERLDLVYAARTEADLEPLTRDLPDLAARLPAAERRPAKRWTVAIFGGVDRKGRWRVGRKSSAFTMFGGTDLDLRHAEIDAPVVTITAYTIFGGLDVYVPEGVDVDLSGFAIFGGNDEHGPEGDVRPDAPLVRVRAFTLFGGADVWRVPREAGELSARELRRRERPPGLPR
jgi:hypothetical protein